MSTDLTTIQHVLNPVTGELVPADNPVAVAQAVQGLRELNRQIRDAIADATTILVEESRRQGTKTLQLDNLTVELKGGAETVYDAQTLRNELEALGCPQERLNALTKVEVTYKVDKRVAKQLAAANEEYAAVIAANESTIEKPYYVRVAPF